MLLPKEIKTKRLFLRPYSWDDIDDLFAYAVDPAWGRFLPVPAPYLHKHAVEFIEAQLLVKWEENPMWAITLNDKCVGGINIRLKPNHKKGDMGYSIGRQYWGRGLMTEAAGTILNLAFTELPWLNNLKAMADLRNTGSWRVMEKIGMIREGCLRQNSVLRGESIDEVWYGILRPEWEAQKTD